MSILCLNHPKSTFLEPLLDRKAGWATPFWYRWPARGNSCTHKAHNRIHLSHSFSTLISHKAKLIDESLAGLTPVLADRLSRNGGSGVLVTERLQGKGEGETEVVFKLLAVGPVHARWFDVWIHQHYYNYSLFISSQPWTYLYPIFKLICSIGGKMGS